MQSISAESISLRASIKCVHDIDDLIYSVFAHIRNRYFDEFWLSQPPIWTARNIQLRMLNECVGAWIPRESRAFLGADTIDNTEELELSYRGELLNSIPCTSHLHDHKLTLKKGFVLISLRSL